MYTLVKTYKLPANSDYSEVNIEAPLQKWSIFKSKLNFFSNLTFVAKLTMVAKLTLIVKLTGKQEIQENNIFVLFHTVTQNIYQRI